MTKRLSYLHNFSLHFHLQKMHLRKEIEKNDKNQQKQQNLKPKEEKKPENVKQSNIQQNQPKKDDTFSINTRYNFNINPSITILDNNKMEPGLNTTKYNQEKIPLDNIKNKTNNNNRININENEQKMNINNNQDVNLFGLLFILSNYIRIFRYVYLYRQSL